MIRSAQPTGKRTNRPSPVRRSATVRADRYGNINTMRRYGQPDALDFHGDRELSGDLVDLAVNVRSAPMPTWLATPISAALADLAAADVKRYRFGDGQVFVRGSHLYVTLPRLAEPPAGKVYQAWTLPKGSKTMAPSITFTPDERDLTVVRLPESALDVAAVAVSVEPAGGSKQPTTKPIALATL